MEQASKTSIGKRLLSCAMAIVLAVGLAPHIVEPQVALADDGGALSAASLQALDGGDSATLEKGSYLVPVTFSCYFKTSDGPYGTHDMSTTLASSKALVKVSDAGTTATVYFGEGSYAIGGRAMATANLASHYLTTDRTTKETTTVDVNVGVSNEQLAKGNDGYAALNVETVSDDAGNKLVRSVTFNASPQLSAYYMQTGVLGDGGQTVEFPYTLNSGASTFYPEINFDWSHASATGYGNTSAVLAPLGSYNLSATLKLATDQTTDSRAAGALKKNATVSIAPDGTAYAEVEFQGLDMFGNGEIFYTKDVKVYNAGTYDANAVTTPVTVLTYQTAEGAQDFPAKVRFAIPEAARGINGVYINMAVQGMPYDPDAFLLLDYGTATLNGSYDADTAAAADIIDIIAALPAASDITLSNKDSVVAARSGYDVLTANQQEIVKKSNLSKLTAAEAKIAELEAAAAVKDQTITTAKAEYTVTYGSTVSLGASAQGALTYTSADTSVATVSSTGVVTGKKVGSTTITISAAATSAYRAATKTVKVTVSAASIAGATVALKKSSAAYTGKSQTATVTGVKLGNVALANGTDYTVTTAKTSKANVGSYSIVVTGKGNYTGTASATYKITKAANPMKLKATSKTLKANKKTKKLASKKTFTIAFKKKAQGKVTYTVAKAAKKRVTVTKAGKVTVKKGTPKGTYKITVKAAGNTNYSASAAKTYKIVVK